MTARRVSGEHAADEHDVGEHDAGEHDAGELAVGDELELDIGPVAHGGICVARAGGPAGRVVFVRYALPGERAVVRITEARPGSFCRGEAVTILRAHPQRVPAPCRHFGPGGCGGCDFQHADPALQRELKAAVVAEQLRRLAGLDVAVTVHELPGDGFGWRTRVRWGVGSPGGSGAGRSGAEVGGDIASDARGGDIAGYARGRGLGDGDGEGAEIVGPRRYRSHAVVPVTADAPCLIAAAGLTAVAQGLRPPRGADEVVLTRTVDGPPAVTWLHGGSPRAHRGGRPKARGQASRFGRSGSSSGNLGDARTGDLVERAAGRVFTVGAAGFWQAHAHAAEVLCGAITEALRGVRLTGGAAWDLYGGVGLFAAVLAGLVGPTGTVTTVESDREASALAALNLRDLPGVLAVRARVDSALAVPGGLAGDVDAVLLDPPRSGAGAGVCRAIAERHPAVIVYVACDPAALARDTAALMAAGYRLDALSAFDAFPQTHHVECVARYVPA